MSKHGFVLLAVLAVCAVATAEAPRPAPVQGPNLWTIDVEYERPQEIVVRLPGEEQDSRYWYVIFSMTNISGRDVTFIPTCELMTDTFQIVPQGTGVRREVFERIKARHQGKYQFMQPLESVESRIRQGEDYTVQTVAIWRDYDPEATGLKFFIAGLSNETAAVTIPGAEDAKPILLRKTLELEYAIIGDPAMRTDANLVLQGRNWVMR